MELGRSHSLRAEGPRMTQPHVCGVHVRAPPRTRQAGSTRLPKACGTPAGAGRELTPGAGAPRSATWGGGRKQRLTAVSPEHTLNLARPRPGHSPTSCHSKSGDRCGTGKQGSTRAADFAKKRMKCGVGACPTSRLRLGTALPFAFSSQPRFCLVSHRGAHRS